ncbi:MAG: hypothetical protein ACP5NW_04100 [Candidatus Woesearchaeota archaeon]
MSAQTKRKIPTRMGYYESTGEEARIEKGIDILSMTKDEIMYKIKKIQEKNAALPSKEFEKILEYLKNMPMQNDNTLNIKKQFTEAISNKNAGEQIQYLEATIHYIKTEINGLGELIKKIKNEPTTASDRNHTGLVATVVSLASIPALFTIGKGITGMAIKDTAKATTATTNNIGTAAIGIYFFIAFAALTAAIIYAIMIFWKNDRKEDSKKDTEKEKITHKIKQKHENNTQEHETKEILHHNALHHSVQLQSIVHPKTGSIRIRDEDAGRYIVAIVAVVGFVAILLMIL